MYIPEDEHVAEVTKRLQASIGNSSLLHDLVDHYCCFIEALMEQGVPFEDAYQQAYQAISPNGAQEIEEELFFLLTIKKQTTMKKVIITTGIIATILFSTGIILKFLHMPGAAVCIVSGIFFLTFLFLPMLFVMNARSAKSAREKALNGLSTLAGIFISLSVVFLVQHWPGAIVLGYAAVAVLLLMFIPLTFVNALKNPAGRLSAVVTSVLVITGSCLWLTLVASPRAVDRDNARKAEFILRNQHILEAEYASMNRPGTTQTVAATLGRKIYDTTEALKQALFELAAGQHLTAATAKGTQPLLLNDKWADGYFATPVANARVEYLKAACASYNQALNRQAGGNAQELPLGLSLLNYNGDKATNLVNECLQLQMMVLQNERMMASL